MKFYPKFKDNSPFCKPAWKNCSSIGTFESNVQIRPEFGISNSELQANTSALATIVASDPFNLWLDHW